MTVRTVIFLVTEGPQTRSFFLKKKKRFAHRLTLCLFVAYTASPLPAGEAKPLQMMKPVSKMRNHPWGCTKWLTGKPLCQTQAFRSDPEDWHSTGSRCDWLTPPPQCILWAWGFLFPMQRPSQDELLSSSMHTSFPFSESQFKSLLDVPLISAQ